MPEPTALIPGGGTGGLGDPFYPSLGNGGYDTEHYTITLDVDINDRTVEGSAEILIKATQEIAAFNLDLYGLNVHQVTINSVPAEYTRQDSELIIFLDEPIPSGDEFTVLVEYNGAPSGVPDLTLPLEDGLGWLNFDTGIFFINEPAGSMGWFPCNNYPTDKAEYTFIITVPEPYAVAANGVLVDTRDNGDTQTYTWEMNQPMSTYLASINIARFKTYDDIGPDGLPLRSYYEESLSSSVTGYFDYLPEMIAFYSDLIAPYPFEAYGMVVLPDRIGVAMENQTLSLFASDMLSEENVAHELAHQWYGDSVTISSWPDIWLNEGFATYMTMLWVEHEYGDEAFEDQMDNMYQAGEMMQSPGDVSVYYLFSVSVYWRGAWVLHALRLTVGDEQFFEILRTYYDHYQYGNVSTDDFIAVAEEISERDLDAFFIDWLYNDQIPDVP
jgi:aminopeptidase N